MTSQSYVYILGPKKFYNETMQYVVQKDMGMQCELLCKYNSEQLTYKFVSCSKSTRCILCLFDYQAMVSSDAFFSLAPKMNTNNGDVCCHSVLYNVQKQSGIEPIALSKGIKGVFYEDDSKELIKKGISTILEGELWYPRKVLSEFVLSHEIKNNNKNGKHKVNLTTREKEILIMLGQGKSNSEISHELCISTSTVKTHVYKIFQKIEVPNRIQAALWTMENLVLQ